MTLVPSQFYDDTCAREYLAQVVDIPADAEVRSVFLPIYDAYFVYAGEKEPALLDMLRKLPTLTDYNKVLCHWDGRTLSLCIAQGKSLSLANTYPAGDFVTVMYYILLALKSLYLNPEISTVCFMTPLSQEQKVSLFHYFKSVSTL